ncbi:hypothetical protein ROZALSC1DRAFT_30253 [Rozella allomycis CSF55]|uniref:Cyclin N-terminal domain-containing protein n=1 Tax=Rozella allomycis (strain CSF55) TaxID=988480 RepID=A0A4P9YI73_ROZAC|nr:hypothetical protein ROZALSC1DRAFT_30253 [Rozella allomycis CSF55]
MVKLKKYYEESAANAIYFSIQYSHEIKRYRSHDIFSEKLHPLGPDFRAKKVPSFADVYKFLDGIFRSTQLNSETAIIANIYMERMIRNTGVTLYCTNWRRCVLGAILLASKVWDDQAIWNVDFNGYFPHVAVQDLNNLERWYLKAINYNVNVKGSTYANYFFQLRDTITNRYHAITRPINNSRAEEIEADTSYIATVGADGKKTRRKSISVAKSKSEHALSNVEQIKEVVSFDAS